MKESAVFGGWNIECIVILIFFLTVFIKTDLKKFLLFTIDQLQNKKSKIGINNTDKEFAVYISILSKELLMKTISTQYNLWGWFFLYLNFKHYIIVLPLKLNYRGLFLPSALYKTHSTKKAFPYFIIHFSIGFSSLQFKSGHVRDQVLSRTYL